MNEFFNLLGNTVTTILLPAGTLTIGWLFGRKKERAEIEVIKANYTNEASKFYIDSLHNINTKFDEYRKSTDSIISKQTKELADTKSVIYELVKMIYNIVDDTCIDKECKKRQLCQLPEVQALLKKLE